MIGLRGSVLVMVAIVAARGCSSKDEGRRRDRGPMERTVTEARVGTGAACSRTGATGVVPGRRGGVDRDRQRCAESAEAKSDACAKGAGRAAPRRSRRCPPTTRRRSPGARRTRLVRGGPGRVHRAEAQGGRRDPPPRKPRCAMISARRALRRRARTDFYLDNRGWDGPGYQNTSRSATRWPRRSTRNAPGRRSISTQARGRLHPSVPVSARAKRCRRRSRGDPAAWLRRRRRNPGDDATTEPTPRLVSPRTRTSLPGRASKGRNTLSRATYRAYARGAAMKALFKDGRSVAVGDVPAPELDGGRRRDRSASPSRGSAGPTCTSRKGGSRTAGPKRSSGTSRPGPSSRWARRPGGGGRGSRDRDAGHPVRRMPGVRVALRRMRSAADARRRSPRRVRRAGRRSPRRACSRARGVSHRAAA